MYHSWMGLVPPPGGIVTTPSSWSHEGEEERKEEEDLIELIIVPMLLQQLLTHHTVRKTIGSRGTLAAPRSVTRNAFEHGSPPAPLAAPPPPAPSEVSPSRTQSLLVPLSPSGNQIIKHLAHLASMRNHGHGPGAWNSVARP
jgi:hypothetical protein